MLTLTSLDILYITLSIFTAIIGTLLSIVLFRVIKILGPVMEIVGYYNQLKQYIAMYAQVPAMIKEKVFEIFANWRNKDDDDDDDIDEEVVEVKKSKKNNKK